MSNDRLAEKASGLHFDQDVRVPFWCECGDPACAAPVPMSLAEYQGVCVGGDAVLAPNHLLQRAEDARRSARTLRDSSEALRNDAKQAQRMNKQRRPGDRDSSA